MSELARIYPPEVHESLAELRRIAKAATSRDDPNLRRCTPDELALAETLRKPTDCRGHSSRTGLPCTNPAMQGISTCRMHGASTKAARHAVSVRLAEEMPRLLDSQLLRALSTDDHAVGFKAAQDLMDRAGIGALVQAKVRASKKQDQGGPSVTVNIGFLG